MATSLATPFIQAWPNASALAISASAEPMAAKNRDTQDSTVVGFALAVAAAVLFKVPALFGVDMVDHAAFYMRNIGFFALPLVEPGLMYDSGLVPWVFQMIATMRFIAHSVAASLFALSSASTSYASVDCGWQNPFHGNAPSSVVRALVVHDDGAGPALYVGGGFTQIGDESVSRIARWNGTEWEALGAGVNSDVRALAVYDDGSGPALYAGGQFTQAGGAPAGHIARWDGTAWEALGAGLDGEVLALTAYDDGTRSRLYVGGRFTMAGNQPAAFLAAWDGSDWEEVGGGTNGFVFSLAAVDNGFDSETKSTDHRLWVGGLFQQAGELSVSNIAEWDGDRDLWFGLSTGTNNIVRAITQRTEGNDEVQYIGGDFTRANVIAFHVAKYAFTQFIEPGKGTEDDVNALTTFDDGTGVGVYAAGEFRIASGVSANRIARWDGTSWSALAGGLSGEVLALASYGSGNDRALYTGGWFLFANGQPSKYIARWLCQDPLIFADSFDNP